MLGLSAKDLSRLANVGWATIQRFEASDGIPRSIAGTLDRVIAALEAEGIEFIGDPIDSPGLQLRRCAKRPDRGAPPN